MLVEVKVPVLSESVAEATLVTWRKKQGDHVERNENLIDVETDKVVLELPAPAAGVLTKIIKGDGTTVVSSEIIATIDSDAKPAAGAAPSVAKPAVAATPATAPAMMPAAKKMATEKGVAPESLTGTGRGGRITKEDVAAQSASPSSPSPTPAAATPAAAAMPTGDRPEQRVAMSRLRARIAERLVQSQSTAAILTTFNEVNMQAIIDLRARYKVSFEKEHGVKLGFTSFFVKAAVAALKKFPILNASVDGNDIVYHGYFDIGIAVGSPRGLVVPIIRDADRLSLAEIEKKIADFGKRAQDGKLTIEELTEDTGPSQPLPAFSTPVHD